MKTKSIRAKLDDAKKIETASRKLAVELERNVTVSEIVEELTKGIEDAKKRIKEKNAKISKKKEN
jgi:DNA-directed RNA polymerase specialized sigma subunit